MITKEKMYYLLNQYLVQVRIINLVRIVELNYIK